MARRHEGSRIEQENLSFARRLLEKGSEFNKKILDREYEQHVRYVMTTQKIPCIKRYSLYRKSQ